MFVDSHCHLDRVNLDAYQGDFDLMLAHAKESGVSHMLCVSVDAQSFPQVQAIAKKYDHIYASAGIHPDEDSPLNPDHDELMRWANQEKIVALGETGLDYFHDSDKKSQQHRFRMHIEVAKEVKKPLIIHTREARNDTISILKECQANQIGGVMHCFTEDIDMAKKAMDLGFYISFSGIVTFKNALQIQEVAQYVPLDRILIETDAPFLTPHPHRGKANYPCYLPLVAEKIAALRHISLEEIAESTTKNFFRLFLNENQ